MSYVDERVRALRTPPMSIEAEQAVLGGVMLSDKAWPEVDELLTDADFYRRDHQLIYRAIAELAELKKPFDAVTLGEWFESHGLSEEVAGGAYLIELASTTPSAANVRAYAKIVRDKAVLRQLIDYGTTVINDSFNPQGRDVSEIVGEAQTGLLAIADDKSESGPRSMAEIGDEWFADLQERYYNPKAKLGILTPWSDLNRVIHSMERKHLVILAARPSMGKSATAVNASIECAMQDVPDPVHYMDLESTGRAIYNRAIAALSRVPLKFLRDPKQFEAEQAARKARDEDWIDTDEFWPRIAAAAGRLKKSALNIDDTPGLNIRQICARARRAYMRKPFRMLVIDHLHLIPLPGKTKESTEIGHITAALKRLAKELDITVLLLSQLNRSVESRAEKRPTMGDLRESGNIEQDADVILLLYRDDYYAEREGRSSRAPGLLEFIVAKQREGEVGSAYAKTALAYGLVEDIDQEGIKEALAKGMVLTADAGDKPKPKATGAFGSGAGRRTTVPA